MNPVKIDGDAVPIGAPRDWDASENGRCATLWVRRDMEGGLPFMRSAWEVTEEEAGWLLAGAKVELGICAPMHPVVNLGVGPLPQGLTPAVTARQYTTPDGDQAVRVVIYLPGGYRAFAQASMPEGVSLTAAVAEALAQAEAVAKREGLL